MQLLLVQGEKDKEKSKARGKEYRESWDEVISTEKLWRNCRMWKGESLRTWSIFLKTLLWKTSRGHYYIYAFGRSKAFKVHILSVLAFPRKWTRGLAKSLFEPQESSNKINNYSEKSLFLQFFLVLQLVAQKLNTAWLKKKLYGYEVQWWLCKLHN